MFNRFEVSYYGHIASNSQCQWIFSQCIFANCPTHKLITFICSCSQCGSCTIVIYTSAFYRTHCWIIHSYGNSMLNCFEVSNYGHIACDGQCQWIFCQCIFANCPTHKLITFICSCSQCGSCTIVIYTSAFYRTHCWIIHSYGNSMLNCFEVSNYGHIACDGQCQWIFCQCIFANCPTHKLITFICSCS